MFKQNVRNISIIMTALLLIMSSLISAQEGNAVIEGKAPSNPVPFTPMDITIPSGGVGESMPDSIASQPDACDFASESYVSAGMDAIRNTSAQFDSITYNNQDEEVMLYALYTLEATEFFGSRARFDDGQGSNIVGDFFDGEVVVIGDESSCVETETFTARLWQLSTGEWVIDTITFRNALDLSMMWDVPAPPNQGDLQIAQPQFPVLVEGVVFRYLMPYIEPPVTAVPLAGDQIASQPQAVCQFGAPSYLSVGMDVMLNGYGYERMPIGASDRNLDQWQLGETEFALSNYGAQVFVDILQATPLVGIPGNLESVLVSYEDLFGGVIEPLGRVVAGPVCVEENAEPAINAGGGVTEAPDPDAERFTTWWQIEVNGVTGWYPENVGQYAHWLWETEGIFNRKLFLYYMVPVSAMMQQSAPCEPTRFFAGVDVQPALSAMNLRNAPNGDVVGRVEVSDVLTLVGTPICLDGANWWGTAGGGYIAENDPDASGYRGLLLPAVQSVAPAENEAAPVAEESTPTMPQAVPTEAPAQPGTAPATRPTQGAGTMPLIVVTVQPSSTPVPRR